MYLARIMRIKGQSHPRDEPTMNVIRKILNGLSFANVNNLGEFRAVMRRIEQPQGAMQDATRKASTDAMAAATEFHHAQGAL